MKRLTILLLCAAGLLAQTAKFPTAIATDQDLLIGKDRSSSTLASGINSSTLSVPVASGPQFTAYESITIDNEQMVICSIDANTLTICTGKRGFNSTAAAAHTAGAAVRGQITSWHHNAAKEEIKAIETALGVGMVNIPKPLTDRGDPAAWDKQVDDFTADATWRDLNLSAIVPAGAGMILLRVDITNNTAGQFIQFRKKGNSNGYNTAILTAQVAAVQQNANLMVFCNSDRIVQYNASNAGTWAAINLLVRGWQ